MNRARLGLGLSASIVLVGVAVGLTGCGTDSSQQLSEVRWDVTPELSTITLREDDIWNQVFLTQNSNLRSLRGDLNRMLLLDRPSRLDPAPIR